MNGKQLLMGTLTVLVVATGVGFLSLFDPLWMAILAVLPATAVGVYATFWDLRR